MTQPIEVDPTKLENAGHHMLSVRDKMDGIVGKLKSSVGAAGTETWGNDKFGKGFADGDDGYLESRTELLSGADETVKSLQQFGQGMIDGAGELRKADTPGA
ncbi:hypothetical protein [Nocardia sp. NPDC051570]|uniref:hypothetical protein n=1 Tax=Nocardia sp. NPDC051570 TaxID=3364324 RepID=UPI0037B83CCD